MRAAAFLGGAMPKAQRCFAVLFEALHATVPGATLENPYSYLPCSNDTFPGGGGEFRKVALNLHGWSLNTFLVSKHVSDPSSGWRLVPFRHWCHSAAFCTRNSARLKRVGNTVPPSEDLRCGWVAGRHPIAGARAARRRAEQPHVHRASATRSVESIPSLDSLSSDPPRFSDILPLRGGWGISDAKGSGRSSGVRGSTRLRSSHGARAEQAQPITRPARPRPLDVLLDPGIGS